MYQFVSVVVYVICVDNYFVCENIHKTNDVYGNAVFVSVFYFVVWSIMFPCSVTFISFQ
jgi:hypothetical protein